MKATQQSNNDRKSVLAMAKGIQVLQNRVSEHFLFTENVFREIRLKCAEALTCTGLKQVFAEVEGIQILLNQQQQALRRNFQSLPEALAQVMNAQREQDAPAEDNGESSSTDIEESASDFRNQGLNLIKEYKCVLGDIREKNRLLNTLYESSVSHEAPPYNSGSAGYNSNNNNSNILIQGQFNSSSTIPASKEPRSPSHTDEQSFQRVLDNIENFVKSWESKTEDQNQRLDTISKELGYIKTQIHPYKDVKGVQEILESLEAQKNDLEVSVEQNPGRQNIDKFLNLPVKQYWKASDKDSTVNVSNIPRKHSSKHTESSSTTNDRLAHAQRHIDSLRNEPNPLRQRYLTQKEESLKLLNKTHEEPASESKLNQSVHSSEVSTAKRRSTANREVEEPRVKFDEKDYQYIDYIRDQKRVNQEQGSAEVKKTERSSWQANRRAADEDPQHYHSAYMRRKSQQRTSNEPERRSLNPGNEDLRSNNSYIDNVQRKVTSAKHRYHKTQRKEVLNSEISQLDKEIRAISDLLNTAVKAAEQ